MTKLNRIIKYLILADLAFYSGWGLVSPIFPLFIQQNISTVGITGESVIIASVAAGVYWITKSIFQYPIGYFLDSQKGDKDDYFFLVLGVVIASIIPLLYTQAQSAWHIYTLQFFYGISMAMNIAGWRALFTRSIDIGKEGSQWSLDDALLGIGQGVSGLLSGICVVFFGFNITFMIATLFGILSVFLLLRLRNDIKGVFDENIVSNIKKILTGKVNKD
ncbi:MAG: MFS transporter [Candidatus Pacebacteria bacterium]|nr:MFS transporter [Candidatus Paceibacterota bacterium]